MVDILPLSFVLFSIPLSGLVSAIYLAVVLARRAR